VSGSGSGDRNATATADGTTSLEQRSASAGKPPGRQPYRPPALTAHGSISEIVRGGEGTNPDGGGVFAFSGAEP